ncbi:MAG: hypothetical protein RR733_03625 [Victivallaceae bacterium]
MWLMCAFLFGAALAPVSSNAMSLFLRRKKKSSNEQVMPLQEKQSVQRSAGFFSKKKIKPRVLPRTLRKSKTKEAMMLPQNFKKYTEPLTSQDEQDIRYVVSSCANKSSLGIAMSQSEIMAALGRIQSLHPFNFLESIHSDSKLKSEFIEMQNRSWIWNLFISRLKEIFASVKAKGLFLDKDIADFAASIGMETEVISSLIDKGLWDDLINLYLNQIS